MDSMLRDVTIYGTAARASATLKRKDLAGKTGPPTSTSTPGSAATSKRSSAARGSASTSRRTWAKAKPAARRPCRPGLPTWPRFKGCSRVTSRRLPRASSRFPRQTAARVRAEEVFYQENAPAELEPDLAQHEAFTGDAQHEGRRSRFAAYPPQHLEQRCRGKSVRRGQGAIGRLHLTENKRGRCALAGVDEQRQPPAGQVQSMLDLPLKLFDQLEARSQPLLVQPGLQAVEEERSERVVAAAGVATGENHHRGAARSPARPHPAVRAAAASCRARAWRTTGRDRRREWPPRCG
jgi:hypothetical protein